MRKKFNLNNSQESNKSYIQDIKENVIETNHTLVRKSVSLTQDLDRKVRDYVYKKRVGGEIEYSQSDVFREALVKFFTTY
jgi:hypothetical protein